MSEKRFTLDKIEKGNATLSVKITDSVEDVDYFIMTKDFYEDDVEDIVDKLNELNDENRELRQTIKEMKSDEKLYADEIVKLNKEAKEVLNFKELGGDY